MSFDHPSTFSSYLPLLSCYQVGMSPARPSPHIWIYLYLYTSNICVCVYKTECIWYIILLGFHIWYHIEGITVQHDFLIQQYVLEVFPCHTYRSTSFCLPASWFSIAWMLCNLFSHFFFIDGHWDHFQFHYLFLILRNNTGMRILVQGSSCTCASISLG